MHMQKLCQPTVHIQYDDLVVGRRQIRVACDADQTRIEMLPANVRVGQMVDGLAVCALVEGLVNDRVVQVPGNIGPRTTCVVDNNGSSSIFVLCGTVRLFSSYRQIPRRRGQCHCPR